MPDLVRRLRRRLHTLTRFLDHLENTMAADRDLITTILAGLGPIAEAIRAKDATIAALRGRLTDAGIAAAADEATDAAALTPVAQAVDAMALALAASPATGATEPEPIPVEQVPAAVEQAASTELGTGDATTS